jgi:hypothetical protein
MFAVSRPDLVRTITQRLSAPVSAIDIREDVKGIKCPTARAAVTAVAAATPDCAPQFGHFSVAGLSIPSPRDEMDNYRQ